MLGSMYKFPRQFSNYEYKPFIFCAIFSIKLIIENSFRIPTRKNKSTFLSDFSCFKQSIDS